MDDIIAYGLQLIVIGGMVLAGIKGLRDTFFRR